ncbi:MAG: glycosyltransferase family 2 protein [Patescibacteria group bacterium]|nr:glycosyltransferase family 2 protein [Patescibacteria group bacterium]
MELSIIIPAYNEEVRLPATLRALFDHLYAHYHGDYEVIVADDGSTDGTAALVRQSQDAYPQLRLLPFPGNRGRGAAVRDAVFSAQGKFILQMDADGSTEMEAVTEFLKYLARHPEAHVLVGSRTVPGAKIVTPQPWLRVFLGYGFLFAAWLLYRWPWGIDRINGFKMFRREAAEDIYRHQFEDGFLAEVEVVFVADRRGWKVVELPIRWTDYRGSRVHPWRESWRSLSGMVKILGRNRKGLYAK